jgi:hypothetical protein
LHACWVAIGQARGNKASFAIRFVSPSKCVSDDVEKGLHLGQLGTFEKELHLGQLGTFEKELHLGQLGTFEKELHLGLLGMLLDSEE